MKTPLVINTIADLRKTILEFRTDTPNSKLGLVPTMGALHEGHLSLIAKSASENDLTVVSVFVNPTQFNDKSDLESYPQNLDEDTKLAGSKDADIIFAPSAKEMYPGDFYAFIDMKEISEKLCGKKREGHFRGVCTVVGKLFNIVTPDNAYFGEKDVQQLTIIKKMVSDLNFNINIVGCQTVRENDGLAMSSRNVHLNPDERIAAKSLYRSLTLANEMFANGEKNAEKILSAMNEVITSEPLTQIDYLEIVDPITLKNIEVLNGDEIIALAVYVGATRLIDNIILR